jgi:hypothetical protein
LAFCGLRLKLKAGVVVGLATEVVATESNAPALKLVTVPDPNPETVTVVFPRPSLVIVVLPPPTKFRRD